MHAANLLNKRRQHREEHRHPAVAKKPTNPNLLVESGSNPSLCSAAATCHSSKPSQQPIPPVATVQEESFHDEPNGCTMKTTTSDLKAPKPVSRDHQMTLPVLYHHYSDHVNCANIGLCIMIVGVVIMIISGFICYLIGFGEPGVIIGVGGAGFVLIGLIVLSFGNSWYANREKAKMRMQPTSYDAERGHSLKRCPQDTQTNCSGLLADNRPASGVVEFSGIIP